MIQSLDDAWTWYHAVRTLAFDMMTLARKWDDPALDEVLARDNRLRHRTAVDLQVMAQAIMDDLDDLAILVMFSVFEATVRDRATADVEREMELVRHPAVLRAVRELTEAIKNGSFARVTEAYQEMDKDLTAQVNQIRKFRNWVAHGRRGDPENNIDPENARARLRRYLARLAEVEATEELPRPPAPEVPPEA
jgi:hypothetical protein